MPEAHKDDPEEWGEAQQPGPRRRLASMISVRLSPVEAKAVKEAAAKAGLSVSAFLRRAALEKASQADWQPEIAVPRGHVDVVWLQSSSPEVTFLSGLTAVEPSWIGETNYTESLGSRW